MLNREFLLLALWGFTVPLAWGYSTRFVTVFLSLREPHHRLATPLAAGIGVFCLCALLGWFLTADVMALLLTVAAVAALRVFGPSVRKPKTNEADGVDVDRLVERLREFVVSRQPRTLRK